MRPTADQITSEAHSLPDEEKLRLVDTLLEDLDRPDPLMDRIWAEEARKRWRAFKDGRIPSVSYADVMKKYRQP